MAWPQQIKQVILKIKLFNFIGFNFLSKTQRFFEQISWNIKADELKNLEIILFYLRLIKYI